MPTPDKPSLDYSYTAFQQGQGNNTFPGTQLDNDLANLKQAIDATIDFTGAVIRDDGKLQNAVVTKSSLAEDVVLGVAAPRPWVTATAYVVDDTATINNSLYICTAAHTSGVFATDLAAGRWALLIEFTVPAAIADGAVTTAKLANSAVTTVKLGDLQVTNAKVADATLEKTKLTATVQAALLPVGASMEWDGPIAPAGWLFKFGQAVSRTTYAALLAVLTASANGNVASASNTITGVTADLRNLGLEGAVIEGVGIPTGTTVVSVTLSTIVLSQNANQNATNTALRVFPHGAGDGSTTFNLPDDRDYAGIGRGNMGGVAASRVSASGTGNPGLDTTRLGVAGGVDRHTLLTAQLPVVTPTGTVTVSYPAHTYLRYASGAAGLQAGANFNLPTGEISANTAPPSNTAFSLSINSFGSGQAHPNVQPSRVTNKIIFTGVV